MKQMTIRIDDETYEKLAYTGDHLGIATATVARIWLKQRADETYMPPRTPRGKKPPQEASSKASPTVRRKNPQGTRSERRTKKQQPPQDDSASDFDRRLTDVTKWNR